MAQNGTEVKSNGSRSYGAAVQRVLDAINAKSWRTFSEVAAEARTTVSNVTKVVARKGLKLEHRQRAGSGPGRPPMEHRLVRSAGEK